MLSATAAERPDAPAITHGDRTLSYSELDRAADRVARFLLSRGIRRGDRVALLMENGGEYVAAFFGALRAGACVVALNHANPPASHAKLLVDSGAAVLMARAAQARKLPEVIAGTTDLRVVAIDRAHPTWGVPGEGELVVGDEAVDGPEAPMPEVGSDDLALILYTSGRRARPAASL